jgi:maltose alpha-D-glucosyltransferase/alpha-amylase
VNVERQYQDTNSLLHWMRALIQARHKNPVLGRGSIEFLAPTNHRVLAYLRRDSESVMLIVASLSRASQAVELDLSAFRGSTPREVFGDVLFPPISEGPYQLALSPYGYYWFRLDLPRVGAPG